MIIIGTGGHAKVLVDALLLNSVEILGVADADPTKKGQLCLGVMIIGSDEEAMKYPTETIRMVNGVGSVRLNPKRMHLFERFKREGYQFSSVIHPLAIIASDAVLSEGVQIMAGAIVQAGCHVGINSIINTGAIVDHDCHIGAHVHISPGAILSGGVRVGEGTHIGTGATIIQGIRIGSNSLVAAGAAVIRNIPDRTTVVGVPAREVTVET